MKSVLILILATSLFVACHNRTEDETGAAPDQGDAAVTATDTAAVQTDTTMAQSPSAADTSVTCNPAADTTTAGC